MTSPDGVTWTSRTSINASQWQSVTASTAGTFVAVANNGLTSTDLMSSTDGITWTQLSTGTFTARAGHQMKVLNGKLYLVGGTNSTMALNDVYSSLDGVTWTLVTISASFNPRQNFQMQVFMGKLFVIGGYVLVNGVDTAANDVWMSSDGSTWIQPWSPNQFTARYSFSSDVGFSGLGRISRIRIYGGTDGTNYLNDAWESFDGGNWQKIVLSNSFSVRSSHSSKKMGNSVYLGCGTNGSLIDDMWRTTVPIV